MYLFEVYFDCAGLCNSSIYYAFTDVSKGPNFVSCSESIEDYVHEYFPTYAVVCMIFAGLFLIGMVGGCSSETLKQPCLREKQPPRNQYP